MIDRSGTAAGFTLIEVLIALVILAVAAGLAFGTVSDSFSRLTRADLEQQAVTVAETALARLGHDLSVQPGHTTGGQDNLRWRIEIATALPDPAPASNLAAYPVTVSVEWRDSGAVRQFRLRSVVLGPEAKS